MSKRYSVIVTRDTTESIELDFYADDEFKAQEFALRLSVDPEIDFTLDEGNVTHPGYVTHCEEIPDDL